MVDGVGARTARVVERGQRGGVTNGAGDDETRGREVRGEGDERVRFTRRGKKEVKHCAGSRIKRAPQRLGVTPSTGGMHVLVLSHRRGKTKAIPKKKIKCQFPTHLCVVVRLSAACAIRGSSGIINWNDGACRNCCNTQLVHKN